jgi:hypothetical protein
MVYVNRTGSDLADPVTVAAAGRDRAPHAQVVDPLGTGTAHLVGSSSLPAHMTLARLPIAN